MTTALSTEQIKLALQGISVPPQPQILVDIHMEQAMPHPDIERIADLIYQDVGLAGSVLKVVNSEFFGNKNRITSIRQAVQLLGIQSVINIVNGLSIKSEMSDETIIAMGRFWDTAMDVAMIAATIAKQIGFNQSELAYNLGLFHNCGMALLMRKNNDYLNLIRRAYGYPDKRIIDSENDALRTNHAVIGYYVARSWKLPQEFCEVIAEHHNVDTIFNNPKWDNYDSFKKTLLSILKMAEHIGGVYHALGDQSRDYEWEQVQLNLLAYVGLSTDDFDNLKSMFFDMGIGAGIEYDCV